MENVDYFGYFEMTRCLGCDQCLGYDTQSQWQFPTPTVLPAILWGSSLAPPCVGQGVEFPRTWDAGILDRNLKSLEMKYSWLLLSDSCLFILPISFLDSSKAAQTNNILMFLLASLIIHYTELLHLSASTFIKSTGLSNSESSNPGFFDCHLWSLGCNRFGCKKFNRDGGLAKQLVAMDLLIFDCSFLNQVYKYVRIVRILRHASMIIGDDIFNKYRWTVCQAAQVMNASWRWSCDVWDSPGNEFHQKGWLVFGWWHQVHYSSGSVIDIVSATTI